MSEFLVIRLHPEKPVDGATFTAYLAGLNITVSSRSFAHPAGGGTQIGTISYDDPDLSKDGILQSLESPPPVLMPAATAVVPITDPAGYPRYNDLVVDVTRHGRSIIRQNIDYDVSVLSLGAPPAKDPFVYDALSPVAFFLALPDPHVALDPSTGYIEVPSDGTPPRFQDLVDVVQKVLLGDPGGSPDISALTPDQCKHIANEIVWNRSVAPLPEPADYGLSLGALYDGSNETQRQQFESDLTTYYTVRGARADVLAKYIYSMSAALACFDISHAATQVGFTFPIFPGVGAPTEKIAETTVVVSQ